MQNKFTLVCINICVFLFLLLGIECAGQLAYFLKNGHPLLVGEKFVNDELFERHPFLGTRVKKNVVVHRKEGIITTTGIGTRWTGAPADDKGLIKVALIGGSTTFGSMVSDKDSWPALLQKMLGDQYAVINYGTASFTTTEGIIQMALVVPEEHPDVVVFYEGWNDISNYHEPLLGADYYSHGIKQIEGNMENERFKDTDWLWFQASQRIFLFKLAKIIRLHLLQQKTYLPMAYDTPDPFVDRIYHRNLQTLKLLAFGINPQIKVFFVPQVINNADFKTHHRPRPWSRFVNDQSMPKLMDHFNSLMNDLCLTGESNCHVVHEVLKVNWQSNDFKDDGHFNRQGGLKFAPIIAAKIKANILSEQTK